MKKYFSKLTLAIILALVMGLAFAAPAMASTTPLAPQYLFLGITKDLQMPVGTVIPNTVFEFSFRQAVVNPPDHATAPNRVIPRPADTVQPMPMTIDNQTINFPADLVAVNGTSNIGQLGGATPPNGFDMGTLTWPHAGQFFFIVNELHNTNPLIDDVANTQETLTYCETSWLLLVTVINYEGDLRISNIQVSRLDPITPPSWVGGVPGTPGHWTGGEWTHVKDNFTYRPGVYVPGAPGTPGEWTLAPSSIRFTNHYAYRMVTELVNPALAISKTVQGPLANQERQFVFNLTFTIPTSAVLANIWDINDPIVATVTDTAGVPIPGRTPATITFTTGMNPTAEFTLSHDEQLRFTTLPAGTTYTITETGVPNYVAESSVRSGGGAFVVTGSQSETGPVGENHTATGLVSNAAPTGAPTPLNLAAFLNTNHTPEIMGLVVGSMPFVIALFGATVILAMMVASRSRQRIEQLPIAY